MRCFARVVALPEPKNTEIPSRINAFRTAGLQDTKERFWWKGGRESEKRILSFRWILWSALYHPDLYEISDVRNCIEFGVTNLCYVE